MTSARPSLMSAILSAAATRIITGKPIKSITDVQLLTILDETAMQLRHVEHVSFARTDTIEKLLSESIRIGCFHGSNWAYDDHSPYTQITNNKHLIPRVVADHLPEMVARFHSLKQ